MRITKSQLKNIINETVTDVIGNICEGKTVSMFPEAGRNERIIDRLSRTAGITRSGRHDEEGLMRDIAEVFVKTVADSFHAGNASRPEVLDDIDDYIARGFMTREDAAELIDKYIPDLYGDSGKIRVMRF